MSPDLQEPGLSDIQITLENRIGAHNNSELLVRILLVEYDENPSQTDLGEKEMC